MITRTTFDSSLDRTWGCLLYYEQISQRPPLLLRLLLPSPIRTEGKKSEVGDEVKCSYRGGYLVKKVTCIEDRRRYGFEVIEQELDVGRGMRLLGGSYELSALPNGRTGVALETRYSSPWRPRWLWKPIEAVVCHGFHRHVLGAMRRDVSAADRSERTSAADATAPGDPRR